MTDIADSTLNAIVSISKLQDFAMEIALIRDDLEGYDGPGGDITPLLKKMKINIPDMVGVDGLIRVDESALSGKGSEVAYVITLAGPETPMMQQKGRFCWRPQGKKWRICIECSSKRCSILIVTDPIVVVTPLP